MTSRLSFLLLLSMVSCGKKESLHGPEPTPEIPYNAYAAATTADLPECNEARKGQLFYVEADKQFRVCRASWWQVIDLRGPTGPSGPTGAAGKDGQDATASSLVASSLYCSGQLEGTPLWFKYQAVVLKSADVFVNGGILDGLIEISGTAFYAKQQNGALTASVLFQDDLLGSANAGYWEIFVNRTTLVTSIVNYDSDAPGGKNTWTMTADRCVLNTYP